MERPVFSRLCMGKKTVRKSTASTSGSNGQPRLPEETIRKLSELLKATDLAEIEVTLGSMRIRVRGHEQSVQTYAQPILAAAPSTVPAARTPKTIDPNSDLHIIRSPFIGTFYRQPSPTSPPFAELNQAVSKGQTLCIVEAMKLMNEIESDTSGVVEKIFVESGTPVEFNMPLFGIRK
jgi:acetyl-CoA carboxylase biotin carboxyl carrier protein